MGLLKQSVNHRRSLNGLNYDWLILKRVFPWQSLGVWAVSCAFWLIFTTVFLDTNAHAQEERIVAIGDIHGDYPALLRVLKSTDLVNDDGDWIGGQTTLIQLGDIPDRGPDTRKIIDYLRALKSQARKEGGHIEFLLGNHEVMNIVGDLRYVHPGEYSEFADDRSEERLDALYKRTLKDLKRATPRGEVFELPEDHRAKWDLLHPPGYVAHRLAWLPDGEYGRWARLHPAIVKVGDTLYLHGGLSPEYSKLSVKRLNHKIRRELSKPDRLKDGAIVFSEEAPFWYRDWAKLPETQENHTLLDAVLARQGASRMVLGHTPLLNVILPRFDGKVIFADAGMSAHYGGGNAAFELVDGKAFAVIEGARVALPDSSDGLAAYLKEALKLVSNKERIEQYLLMLESDAETPNQSAKGDAALSPADSPKTAHSD